MRLLGLCLLVAACGSASNGTADADLPPECTGPSECDTAEICEAGQCVPASCGDDQLSGNESDIDCGGDCPPCTEGQICAAASDCSSRYCSGERCRDCVTHADCEGAPGTFCSGGLCRDQRSNGASCEAGAECASTVCETEGVCCNSPCDGNCQTGTCMVPACTDDLVLATLSDTQGGGFGGSVPAVATVITPQLGTPSIGRNASLADGTMTTNVFTSASESAFDGVINQLVVGGSTQVYVAVTLPGSGGGAYQTRSLSASLLGKTVTSVHQVVESVTLTPDAGNTDYEVVVTWQFRGCN